MRLAVFFSSGIFFFTILLVSGCSKYDFLNEKPRKSLLIPATLDHFQAILDADHKMNGASQLGVTPQLGESGSDNFYLLESDFATLRPQMQNYYLWAENPYAGINVDDYTYPYEAILYANTVIDGLESVVRNDQNKDQFDNIAGQAYFHRAHMLYQLAQVFAPPYDLNGDNSKPGLFLRLHADINEKLERGTVGQSYDRIISDLSFAVTRLNTEPAYKTRPSKQAAYALLARTYLSMRDYRSAKLAADSCLAIQDYLLDYNTVNSSVNSPFQGTGFTHPINQEIIFFSAMRNSTNDGFPITFSLSLINEELYSSYHVNDLRRAIFFSPRASGHRFKGSYSFRGRVHYFSGLAVDEVLLIRAECNARLGNVDDALLDLNRLLSARWRHNTFVPVEVKTDEEALSAILTERRKELVYRGLRWTDLRRFNMEGQAVSVSREVGGEVHVLLPNDPRWTWPLPPEVIL